MTSLASIITSAGKTVATGEELSDNETEQELVIWTGSFHWKRHEQTHS